MRQHGQEVREGDSLLQNLKHYLPDEKDMLRLTKEESTSIFETRQRTTTPTNMQQTDDILRSILFKNNILHTQTEPSEATANILPGLLGSGIYDILPETPTHTATAPQNKPVTTATSSTSSTSSSSSEHTLKELRDAVKTMGEVLGQLVTEVDHLTKEMKMLRQERDENEERRRRDERTERENRNDERERPRRDERREDHERRPRHRHEHKPYTKY